MIPQPKNEDLNSSISTIRGWVRDNAKSEDVLIREVGNSRNESRPRGDRNISRRSTEDESSEESRELALPSPLTGKKKIL